MSKVRSIAVVAVVVIAGLAAIASTDDNEPQRVDDNGESAEGESTGDAPEEFVVGDVVQLGDWQVTVHGVTDPVVPSTEFLTPAAGTRWVAVDTEVTNTGESAETVSSLLCFELRDGSNRSYTLAITGEAIESPPDGEVAPGQSRRGTIIYEVPEAETALRLDFQCDLLSSGTASIVLS